METTNLSKIRRDKMLNTINEIKKGITDEQTLTNLSMIENELTKKKYGLIWEEHEERVDVELKDNIPVFNEMSESDIQDEATKYAKSQVVYMRHKLMKGLENNYIYHTVTFNSNGGSPIESQRVKHGEKAIKPSSNKYVWVLP